MQLLSAMFLGSVREIPLKRDPSESYLWLSEALNPKPSLKRDLTERVYVPKGPHNPNSHMFSGQKPLHSLRGCKA